MMKKVIALLLALVLMLGCAGALAEGNLSGGWIVLEDDDPSDMEDRAEDALKKATANLTGAIYDEEAVLGYQIVAGTNYCLLCRVRPVTPNAASHWALVYVYEALDGKCEILEVQDIVLGLSPAAN